MAFRSQAPNRAGLIALFAITCAAGADLRFDVRHQRAAKDHAGVLIVSDAGIRYQQVDPKPSTKPGRKLKKLESQSWQYVDIQQLWISPEKLRVLTYEDRKWRLGMDREFEFVAAKDQSFQAAYDLLKRKLDRRLVGAVAGPVAAPLWSLRVKLLGTLKGSEGTLTAAADQIVYRTSRKGHSRIWRLEDIENVSTADPYQLTLVTYERARLHYGSRRGFDFQLKEPLDEQAFQALWRKLNQTKGLQLLQGW